MTKKGIGAQQKTVCWSCTVHLVLGGLLGAGSLWPLNTMRTPGNNCWIWTAAESLASSVWTLGLLSKLYPYSLTTSGVDVIQKQFDGKKLQEIARLWSLFFLVTMKIHGFAVNPNKQKVVERSGSFKGKHSGLLSFLCFLVWVFLLCFFFFFLFYWDLGFCFCCGLLLFEKIPPLFFFLRKLMAALLCVWWGSKL